MRGGHFMLNFVICDDNQNIVDKLAKILESIFIEHELNGHVLLQTIHAEDVLNLIQSDASKIDVLILDIQLKSAISGLAIAEQMRHQNKNTYLIFTTGHLEYVMLAYKYKTFDYLPKPITFAKIEETILRLFQDASHNSNPHYLTLASKNVLINEDDVYYIKKDGMRTIFITPSKSYEIYSSFSKIESSLPPNFIRCHKSYIVNIHKITDIQFNTNTIFLKGNISCSIGPKYKNNLLEVIHHDELIPNHLVLSNHAK